MKKFVIVLVLCSFLFQVVSSQASCAEVSSRSFWSGLVNTCCRFSHVAQTTLRANVNWVKSIGWSKNDIVKTGIVAAAAATIYGAYRLVRKIFRRPRNVAGTGGNRPAPEAPGLQPVPVPPAPTQATQEPIPAPVPAVPAPIPLPPFQAATDETLAVVPYFADPAHHVIEPVEFENPVGTHVTVQQLGVLDQFIEGGGGGASCGYQAGPKNAVAITGLIQGLNTGDRLTSSAVALRMFNPHGAHIGQLRIIINNNRIKTALKSFYLPQLTVLQPEPLDRQSRENTGVIQTFYRQFVNEYLDNAIAETVDFKEDKEITLEGMIEAFQAMLLNIPPVTLEQLGCTEEELTQFVRDEQTIRRYVQVRAPLRISRDDIQVAWTQYNAGANRFPQNGDMLNSDEIMYLFDDKRKQDGVVGAAMDPRAVSVNVVEDTTPETLNVFEEITGLRDQIQSGQLPERKIHAFVLGNTDQKKQMAGHWVTMVLECARNRRRYTITNSADNHISMFQGTCANMIRYLEGDGSVQLLRPSEATKQRILGTLRQSMAQCSERPRDRCLKYQLEGAVTQFQEFVDDYSSFDGQQNFVHEVLSLLMTPQPPPVQQQAPDASITTPATTPIN